jgi:hypothetical protein
MDKALFYSMLLENFGPDPILKLWMPRMRKLAESQQVRKSATPTYKSVFRFLKSWR